MATSEDRIAVLKEFFKDILEQKDYIENRKSILRKRAGLREKDRRVVPFSFLDRFCKDGSKIQAVEVEHGRNVDFLLEFMAQFCDRIPTDQELQEALVDASMSYCLNPHLTSEAEHFAWASVESGVQRGFAGFLMVRFQKTYDENGLAFFG
eukprot:symbB.v1.2.036787.t1/scaffold5276.1/size31176/1